MQCIYVCMCVYNVAATLESRRRRYRNQRRGDTISRMLQDGEKHQVWKPGRRCNHDMLKPTSSSPDQRQRTLFDRIHTFRTGGGAKGKATPMSSMQRRMEQWKKIEAEAMKLNEMDAANMLESAAPGGLEVMPKCGEGGYPEAGGGGAGGGPAGEERRGSTTRRGSNVSQVMTTILEEEEEEGDEGEVFEEVSLGAGEGEEGGMAVGVAVAVVKADVMEGVEGVSVGSPHGAVPQVSTGKTCSGAAAATKFLETEI